MGYASFKIDIHSLEFKRCSGIGEIETPLTKKAKTMITSVDSLVITHSDEGQPDPNAKLKGFIFDFIDTHHCEGVDIDNIIQKFGTEDESFILKMLAESITQKDIFKVGYNLVIYVSKNYNSVWMMKVSTLTSNTKNQIESSCRMWGNFQGGENETIKRCAMNSVYTIILLYPGITEVSSMKTS